MFYGADDLRGGIPLSSLPRLASNEAVNYIDLVPVRYSRRLGGKIITLEDAYNYMRRHSVDFDTFLEEVSSSNSLTSNNTYFAVQESSVYTNNTIKDIYMSLEEHNMPVYNYVNHNSREYKLINFICEECIRENSTELLDILMEDGILDVFSGIFNQGAEQVRSGTREKLGNFIDNKVGNFFGIDRTEKRYRFDDKTGKSVEYDANIKNAGLSDKLHSWADKLGNKVQSVFGTNIVKNNPNATNSIINHVGSTLADMREGLGKGVLNQLENLVGIDPNRPFDIRQVINTIGERINNLRTRGSAGGGIMTSLINKLIALKNQLMKALNRR